MSEKRVVVRKDVKGWEAFEIVIRDYRAFSVFMQGCYWLRIKAASEWIKAGEWKVRIVMGKREKQFTDQAAQLIERVVNLLESNDIRCGEALSYQWSLYDDDHHFIIEEDRYSVSVTGDLRVVHERRHLEEHSRLKSRLRVLVEVIGRLENFNVISY